MLAATSPHGVAAVSGRPGMSITTTGGGDDQLGQQSDRLRGLLGNQRLKTRLAHEEIVRSTATVALTATLGRSLDVVLWPVHTGANKANPGRTLHSPRNVKGLPAP